MEKSKLFNKWLGLLLFSVFTLPKPSIAAEREHKIHLISGQVKEVTTAVLQKDFPTLVKVKTSLQGEEVQEFEGVLLADFIKKYAPAGTTKVKVSATNNYTQTLTEKDWKEWNAVLAFKSNGLIIPTKTRGTFRIIYDYEKYKSAKDIAVILETNSVWQVVTMEFLK